MPPSITESTLSEGDAVTASHPQAETFPLDLLGAYVCAFEMSRSLDVGRQV